jgi:AcrR family transcriptional regulator
MSEPGVRRKQADRREEAERRLVQAAIELISERGFQSLTLADVGERAGYSRGLPGHYFGIKDNLIVAVASHILDSFASYADRSSQTADRGLPTIIGRLRAYARAARRNRDISRATVMIYADALVNQALAARLSPLIQERTLAYKEELRAGMALGNVDAQADVEAVASALLAFVRGALGLSQLDPEYPLEAAFESYIAGLSAQLKPHTVRSPPKPQPRAGKEGKRARQPARTT